MYKFPTIYFMVFFGITLKYWILMTLISLNEFNIIKNKQPFNIACYFHLFILHHPVTTVLHFLHNTNVPFQLLINIKSSLIIL